MTFRNNSSPPVLEMKQNRFSSPTLTPIFLQWKCCDGFLCQWFHAEIPGYVWWRKIPRTYLFVPFLKVNNTSPKQGQRILQSIQVGMASWEVLPSFAKFGEVRTFKAPPAKPTAIPIVDLVDIAQDLSFCCCLGGFLPPKAIWTTCGEAVKLGEKSPLRFRGVPIKHLWNHLSHFWL